MSFYLENGTLQPCILQIWNLFFTQKDDVCHEKIKYVQPFKAEVMNYSLGEKKTSIYNSSKKKYLHQFLLDTYHEPLNLDTLNYYILSTTLS